METPPKENGKPPSGYPSKFSTPQSPAYAFHNSHTPGGGLEPEYDARVGAYSVEPTPPRHISHAAIKLSPPTPFSAAWDFNNISHESHSSNEESTGKAGETKPKPTKQLVFTTIPSLQIQSSPSAGLPHMPEEDHNTPRSGDGNLEMYDCVGEDARDDQVRNDMTANP
jgi:hypothetical protein